MCPCVTRYSCFCILPEAGGKLQMHTRKCTIFKVRQTLGDQGCLLERLRWLLHAEGHDVAQEQG